MNFLVFGRRPAIAENVSKKHETFVRNETDKFTIDRQIYTRASLYIVVFSFSTFPRVYVVYFDTYVYISYNQSPSRDLPDNLRKQFRSAYYPERFARVYAGLSNSLPYP